jgi:hypothetical protein
MVSGKDNVKIIRFSQTPDLLLSRTMPQTVNGSITDRTCELHVGRGVSRVIRL